MGTSLNQQPLSIACPGCGKEIKKTIGWFKRSHDCPFCGARFKADRFRRDIQKAEKALAEFIRQLK